MQKNKAIKSSFEGERDAIQSEGKTLHKPNDLQVVHTTGTMSSQGNGLEHDYFLQKCKTNK